MKYSKQQIINIKENLERYCKPLTEKDSFRYNHSESKEHNKKIADQFIELQSCGFCVSIRPTLKNNNIPDILILSGKKPYVKEVMKSESDERFEEKDYMGIDKIKVRI